MSKLRGILFFNDGIPTKPDVDKLLEEIGVPAAGDSIAYSRITEVTGITRKTSRWVSVTNAWRKHLQDKHGIVLKAAPNEGFNALDDNGKTDTVLGYVKRAKNSFRRADKIAIRVDRQKLSEDRRISFDHYGRVRAALELADKVAAKQLDYPDPQIKQSIG